MDSRYEIKEITNVCAYESKWLGCQKVELAVTQAKAELRIIPLQSHKIISEILAEKPINIKRIKEIEEETNHDYNAFLKERREVLRVELQKMGLSEERIIELESLIHGGGMTTYDGQEAMFAMMLLESIGTIRKYYTPLEKTLKKMAVKYRHTVMYERTHGQGAKLKTFGAVCLGYIQELRVVSETLENASQKLAYSKISGAVGNWGSGLTPEIEKQALAILGFKPFPGASQIMPRVLYAPIGNALAQLALTLHRIANNIRLGARSGNPIFREPIGKKFTGSSVMPNKQNTILSERMEGAARLAEMYASAIQKNIVTWEARSIEMSIVERVVWPDIFHITVYSLKLMDKILSGLRVYPDNMMREIINSCGCYAADEATDILKKLGISYGITHDDAYRIVQLAAFNIEEANEEEKQARENLSQSFAELDNLYRKFQNIPPKAQVSIQCVISSAKLKASSELAATEKDIARWNQILEQIFRNPKNIKRWDGIFLPSHILENEKTLYAEILGIE